MNAVIERERRGEGRQTGHGHGHWHGEVKIHSPLQQGRRAEGQSHRRGGHLTRSLSKTRKNKNKGGENTVCNIILPADVCLNFSLFFFLHFQGLKRRPMVANLLLWRMGGLWAPGMKDSGRMAERLSTSSAKSIHRQTNREIKIKTLSIMALS